MTIEAYLAAMKERLVGDPIVTHFHVIRERSTLVDGHICARVNSLFWKALRIREPRKKSCCLLSLRQGLKWVRKSS